MRNENDDGSRARREHSDDFCRRDLDCLSVVVALAAGKVYPTRPRRRLGGKPPPRPTNGNRKLQQTQHGSFHPSEATKCDGEMSHSEIGFVTSSRTPKSDLNQILFCFFLSG